MAFLRTGEGKRMKLSKLIAIPAIALTAGLGVAACGSVKAPALGLNHTLTALANPRPAAQLLLPHQHRPKLLLCRQSQQTAGSMGRGP